MTAVSFRNQTATPAANYQRHFVPAIAGPASADLLAVADLQPGERVLDVACGTGVIARLAAARVGSTGTVSAIDLSEDMIDVAKATPAPPKPVIEWRTGNAMSLPLDDERYDVVTCQMGLMFMEDRRAALVEMRRVLVAGGRVVVNTPGAIQAPFALMEQAIVDHISADLGGFVRTVFSMHDPFAVGDHLRDAGFCDVDAQQRTATLQLPGPAEFVWQYINLTPMAPFVAKATEAAKTAMERQVVETWQPYVVGGATPVDQPMVIATGRR
ncbi:MAG TPA: methyltransferase domain-containing protein [Acidimicrobiales bacterium]|nr:methyltransferase domain-containing protein [Acidimicrobiales bacterium]